MARRTSRATAPVAVVHPIPTVIEFLLDETGSMSWVKRQCIGGFNDFLKEQRANPGLALLTLTKFDTTGLKTPYVDIDVRQAPDLTWSTFNPGASTNLRDAIIQRSAALADRISKWTVKPHVLFICMTDGHDNASHFAEDVTRTTITANMGVCGWTYAYLGADQNAINIGTRLGFPEGNCKSFASAEMQQALQHVATATTAYRAARAASAETYSSTDYFSARG
jgi:hypothetical protein